MAKTIAQLRQEAQTIRDAVAIGENTAARVGGTIEDVVDYLDETGGGDVIVSNAIFKPLTIQGFTQGSLDNNTGAETSSNAQLRSMAFYELPKKLHIKTNGYRVSVFFYDSSKTFLPPRIATDMVSDGYIDMSAYPTAKYIRFRISADNITVTLANVDFNKIDIRLMGAPTIEASTTIVIAASNSNNHDKEIADFVCSGTNDELTINNALLSKVSIVDNTQTRGVDVVLMAGDYYIDSFPNSNSLGKYAIKLLVPTNTTTNHLGYRFRGVAYMEDVYIHVTASAYAAMNTTDDYMVFGASSYTKANHYKFEDIQVIIPDSQKKIICFDGRNFNTMGCERVKCLVANRGNYSSVPQTLPIEGCIAFRGTFGSNNMFVHKWEYCQAEGFGQGFAVGGEHLMMYKCAAVFGLYGYTFGNYSNATGALSHAFTMIGCLDEANANLWKFGNNTYKQTLCALNTSFEVVPAWFARGGNYATESTAGQWCGVIEFVANAGFYTTNSVSQKFWANGSGKNFRTTNLIQKQVGTTSERNGYAPNFGQLMYDTTLGKLVICIDADASTWVDVEGNAV